MDHQIEMPQTFLPIERRLRPEWPWCKGFIVQGVFYSSQVAEEDSGDSSDFFDLPRGSQRGRAPLA
jgi:hypothetical protein